MTIDRPFAIRQEGEEALVLLLVLVLALGLQL
jgi:hypothetical protein